MKQHPHEAGRLAVQWGCWELCSGNVLLGLVRLGPLNPPVSELKELLCSQPCPVSALTEGPGLHRGVLFPRLPGLHCSASGPQPLVGKGQMNLAKCGSVVPPAGPLTPELCLLLQDRIGEGRMCAELCSPCCPRRAKLGKAVFCLRVSAEPEALAAPHCKSTPERWPLERLSLTNLASQLHFQGSPQS